MSRANHPSCVRRGFTLVEMLVVIGIVGLLAALVTPVAMGIRRSARIAAIRTEIDLLNLAFENYEKKYGILPPCGAEPRSNATDPAGQHLTTIFPRLSGDGMGNWPPGPPTFTPGPTFSDPVCHQAQLLAYMNTGPDFPFRALGPASTSLSIRPDNAIVIWLRGYSADPIRPVLSTTASIVETGSWNPWQTLHSGTVTVSGAILPRVKLFDFDEARITSGTASNALQYYPAGLPQSPYHYVNSGSYSAVSYSGSTAVQLSVVGAQGVPRRPLPAKPSGAPDAWYFTVAASGTTFFNPDGFQILCAGVDGVFGTDDDLSNFWRGTRRDYLDSLRSQ